MSSTMSNGTDSTYSSNMSDSSTDTSVGSSPYQSDEDVMTYFIVGEAGDTDDAACPTTERHVGNEVEQQTSRATQTLAEPGPGIIPSLQEENIRLRKRIEELESFDWISFATEDSGFFSEGSSLASSNRSSVIRRSQKAEVHRGVNMKEGFKRFFAFGQQKQREEVARPIALLRVGNSRDELNPEAARSLPTPVTQMGPRVDTDIHTACKKGDLDRLRRILSKDLEDVNRRGKDGLTPAMITARFGHRRMVDILVSKGSALCLLADNKNNILHEACIGGHVDMVKYVLSQKVADINSRGQYGRTSVMLAAEKGHSAVFDSLVREGADVSLVDDDGDNILHVACIEGHVDVVKYVLSQKVADINSRGQYGRNPVMLAAEKGHRAVFDLLVREGADVSLLNDNRNNILHEACIGGHVDMVKYVLSQKVPDINSRGQYGRTPVMMAAEMGHREVFDLLVREGADVSLLNDNRNNILHEACIGGHVDMVKYVLSQKVADINSRGQFGRTPVMKAAKRGHREVFELLVSEGANVSLVDDDGDNILHVACIEGHVDMLKYVLLLKVADINSRGQYGRNPVMLAAEKGHRAVFDLLVREGADVSLLNDNRNNILHEACIGGHVDMVKYVLSQKVPDINSRGQYERTPVMMAAEMGHREKVADINSRGQYGRTPVMLAAEKGYRAVFDSLLSQKVADINSRGQYGRTPVMLAAEKGYRAVFDSLVREGADVSLVNDNGINILHVACIGGHVDIVKYVLSQKVADINSRGQYGRTPVMLAAEMGHREVFDLLVREGADYGRTPVMKAAEMGHREVFDLLVKEGADVSLVDDNRNNILHVACIEGHVDMVKYVLSQKVADINSHGQYGGTPVMVAAKRGHIDVFDLLVREGANVSLVDDNRDNILHVACIGGHVDMVKYVLSQNVADINSQGQYGGTPVMVVAEMGHREVFDVLVKEGADVSFVDDNRNNILHVACIGGHVDMVKYVLSQKVADINSQGQYGRTPVMMAANTGHREVFDVLVREGADVSLVDDNRNNILHLTCIGGHEYMVKNVLSQKVADINSQGPYGRTPVMVAAEIGHRKVFDVLVSEGADVSLVDDNRNNILHVACIGGHVDMVKYVLSQKVADINSRGEYGRTPVMMAANTGHREVFDVLVREGADVSLVDDNRNNILHVTCIGGHEYMVKYVLSQKFADINSQGPYGRTPVMVAAEIGHRKVFDVLVSEGADVSLVDDNRNNILHVACIGGHVDMVKYVLSLKVADINSQCQYGRTPVMKAANMGHREVFDVLVSEGADVSLVDDDRDNILHVACIGGHVDMVKYVLSQKVANINSRGQYGRTPVMVAAKRGHREVFDLLVKEGADVSLVDDDRDYLLHVACIGGHVDMVKYVLSQKVADINSQGPCGRTPVMVAAEMGHREVFDVLVKEGADVSLVDDNRNNILHVACIGGHVDMVKYVLSQKVAD
ncbi:serine/threonine-protein phosphatase 6 regulatory ankyrin repeat subunit A-like, partial [Haliotis rubra]|uniref:serine/threonine-protein phosphatase 6 regulatory ankyrin repeat subunit A-like n=1 Tax=Haliotis rubra TaxID=36100 RepID=UPI001EE54BD6